MKASRVYVALGLLLALAISSEARKRLPVDGFLSLPNQHHEGPIFGSEACPQKYLLGAMKCGTTTLFGHMRDALEFYDGVDWHEVVKEIHTFDQFTAPMILQDEKRAALIDASPSYIRNNQAPVRMKAFCNFTDEKPKFVVSLCDPASRAWSHFRHLARTMQTDEVKAAKFFRPGKNRVALTDETIGDAFRECVHEAVPRLKKCLEKFSYEQCGELLYGLGTPGSAMSAFQEKKPCAGVVYSSMYSEQMDTWTKMFPKDDFLVIYLNNWATNPEAAVRAISDHWEMPMKEGAQIDPDFVANHHDLFDGLHMPEDVLEYLNGFFGEHNKWQDMATMFPPRDQTPSDEM